MRKKKQIISLKVIGEKIHLVRFVRESGLWNADAVRKIDISGMLKKDHSAKQEEETVTAEDIFGISAESEDQASVITADTPPALPKKENSENEDDDFLDLDLQLGENDDINDLSDSFSSDVTTLLEKAIFELGGKKPDIAVVYPSGSIGFHQMTVPKELKSRKKIHEHIRQNLITQLNAEYINDDQFRWLKAEGEIVNVAVFTDHCVLTELLENVNAGEQPGFTLRTSVPEEIALISFVDEVKETDSEIDEELRNASTGLIHLTSGGARILFVKDGLIQSTMAQIRFESRVTGTDYVNKVLSKIMLELEKGKVHYIGKFLVHDETGYGPLLALRLTNSFDGVNCFPLFPETELAASDGVADSDDEKRMYTSMYGAARIAAGQTYQAAEALSFIPVSIIDRQKVFKLKWHGILLLVLIAISPFLINMVYQSLKTDYNHVAETIQRQEAQLNDMKALQSQFEMLEQEIGILSGNLSEVQNLGNGTKKWTETLGILHSGMPEIPNTWFTSMQYTDGRMILEGTTMFRQRIPLVAELFHDAGIQQVTSVEMRDRNFFNYLITVNKITGDESRFDPEIPQSTGLAEE